MTRLERYKEKLKEFEHKRNNFMRQGRYDLMRRLDNDIADLRKEIANAEQYEAKPIKQLLSSEEIEKHNLIPMLFQLGFHNFCLIGIYLTTQCMKRCSFQF